MSNIIQHCIYLCAYFFCLLSHLENNCMKEKMLSVLFTPLISTRNIAWPVHSKHLVNIEWMNVLGPSSAYLSTFWVLPLLIFPLILCLCPCCATWRLERSLRALLCIAMPWPSEFLMANLDRDGNITTVTIIVTLGHLSALPGKEN